MNGKLGSIIRTIWKQKGLTAINIIGLSLAISICLLIFLWCRYELSYDRENPNFERIYRVNTEFHLSSEVERYTSSPEPTGPTLVEEFPEITHTARFYSTTGLMVYEDKKFMEEKLVFTDQAFIEMFNINVLKGDPDNLLEDPYSLVLTESTSEKYFGSEEPVGKVIRRNDRRDFTVTGVIEDLPENSSFNYDFLMSTNLFYDLELGFVGAWSNISGQTFIMTSPGVELEDLSDKIWNVANEKSPEQKVCNLWLQPLSQIHLYDLEGGGAIQYIYIFAAIGFIVLMIALINFMNLATACSSNRAKEVGMRRVGGANRRDLVAQFLKESVFMSFLALFLALIIVELSLPFFEEFAQFNIRLNWKNDFILVPILLLATLLTGLIAGSYPAFFLSSYDPLRVIKGIVTRGKKGVGFRRIMVIVQFTLSILLIICTMVVYNQMEFLKNRELGFNKDNMIYLFQRGELQEKFPEFKEELLKLKGVEGVTRSGALLTDIGYVASGLHWEGQDAADDPIFSFDGIDYDYIETFGFELVSGRAYDQEMSNDEKNYILNEAAVQRIGYDDPIGKPFNMWGREGKIIGVVKDFSYKNATETIAPLILTHYADFFYYIHVKLNPLNTAETIKEIRQVWGDFVSQYPLEYNFLNEDFARMYRMEERMGTLFKIFSGFAVFIACLGLLGLSAFAVQRRTKEVGIRKVLGASVRGLVIFFLKDFTRWVVIANIIAWPLAYYVMSNWLQNYIFRVDLTISTFIVASIIAFSIAVLTVLFHTLRAANANPVEALKYE